jgi:hypothetical protein
MRKLMRFAGILALSGVALAVTGGSAARAQDTLSSHYGGLRDHCVGTRIASHQIKNKRGKVIGRTELWYSRANGGQNCVMTYNGAGSPFTRTYIWRLKRKGGGLADASAGDSGFYKYYAGGSFVNNANGRCVTWGGTVGNFSWFSKPGGVHCG